MPSLPLEKHIKMNAAFVNEYYKVVVGIIVLNNSILLDLENYLSNFKLTYQQFNILRILKGQYPNGVQLSLIKERMLHKQSDVSRLVDRLVGMGWVSKKVDEENKRKLYIGLSEEGLALINSIDINGIEFKSLMTHLNTSEIKHFNELIGKIISKMGENSEL
jgi:DNA-binding MarR family transcriptional regulator